MSALDTSTVMAVLALVAAALAAWAWMASRRARKSADDAEAAIRGALSLREGGTLVSGKVLAEGEPAITVRIVEGGTERSDGGHWTYEWNEVERKVTTRSFVVVTDQNERIHVDVPSSRVLLIHELLVSARPSPSRRERTAELVDGERVTVSGRLRRRRASDAGAYRSPGEEGWVIEPPAGSPLVVSTEPMAAHHRARAVLWRRVALAPLAFVVAGPLLAAMGPEALAGLVVLALLAAILVGRSWTNARTWWERERLHESGRGRLDGS